MWALRTRTRCHIIDEQAARSTAIIRARDRAEGLGPGSIPTCPKKEDELSRVNGVRFMDQGMRLTLEFDNLALFGYLDQLGAKFDTELDGEVTTG